MERMIEAFAFLTARVGLKLDDELPEITESFINLLYPHYLAPIPSMAIAQFSAGSPKDKLSNVASLPRGSRLNSRPVDGTPCQFRTASPPGGHPMATDRPPVPDPGQPADQDHGDRFS